MHSTYAGCYRTSAVAAGDWRGLEKSVRACHEHATINRSSERELAAAILLAQDIMIPFRLTILAALLVSGKAFAQTREPFQAEPPGPLLRSDVAGSRQHVGLDPSGIRVGGLIVQPSVTARVEGDSNVLNRATNKRGDVFVVLTPSINAAGGTEEASYVVRAQAAVSRFASIASQNSETFGIEANGRLALTKKASLFARIAFERRNEPRGQAGETIVEGSPAEFDQIETQIAARAESGAVRLTASATATKRDYADITQADGKINDQAFRATNAVALGLKAEYALRNGATLIAAGTLNQSESPQAPTCCDQSSKGGQLTAGVRAEVSNLISAEVTSGYVFRDYSSPVYKDFNGLVWQAKLDWYPTQLMSFSLSGGRKIVSSGIPAVAGIVVDSALFQFFYEVRRNLDVIGTFARSHENYREIDTTANATVIGVEARYILSSRLAGGLYSRLRDRISSNPQQLQGGSGLEGGLWLRASM